MTEMFQFGDTHLTGDLKALDEELSSLRYEERPSFGPELRAELARTWAEAPAPSRGALRRNLVAATIAALLVGGAAVPSARASFVRLIGVLSTDPVEVDAPIVLSQPPRLAIEERPVVEEPAEEAVPVAPVEAVVVEDEPAEVVRASVVAVPELLDRLRAEELLEDAYPRHLQREGVGGTVGLRLWIEVSGRTGAVEVDRSSGIADLDRAAREVASQFVFSPALVDGRRMGTWIEFPVRFEPDADLVDRVLRPVVDPFALPDVDRSDWWQMSDPLDLEELRATSWSGDRRTDDAVAEAALIEAIGDPTIIDDFGPAVAILDGEPPVGMGPTRWRTAVGASLETAVEAGRANPASYLALGRIRMRQGLRTEARSHFERGLQMAVRDPARFGLGVVAELHYERGSLVRETWLSSNGVGRVRAEAFRTQRCAQARSTGGAETGFSSVERLIAWNYLCPRELSNVFATGFQARNSGSAGDLTLMMASYRAAIEAWPAHVGANTDLLVTLAAEGRWDDVLSGARRFTRVTEGHPNGLLLAGLALHELGRPQEAEEHFLLALDRLPEGEASELTDVVYLLDVPERHRYRALDAPERATWEAEFWAPKDPTPETVVNEGWVEHLSRTAFAHLRFGSVFGDAGEVWVRFGGPTTIHIVDEGSGRLTEFWDYGSGPDITFVRWVSAKRTDLTPEGRAYVDDLGTIFPPQ